MKSGARSAGFTIVETMIVMAVTGVLFVSIVVATNGRTSRAQFTDAINSIQLELQQEINDVQSGFYPNAGKFTCKNLGNKPYLAANPTGVSNQGTNLDCIYIGKAIQFGVDDGSQGASVNVYTLAGIKQLSGNEVANLSEARVIAIAPRTGDMTVPSATVTRELRYGLTAKKVTYTNAGSTYSIGGFAIVSSFPKTIASGSQLASGSQQFDIVPITGSSLNMRDTVMAERIKTSLPTAPINPDGGIKICFDSGTTANESGVITIGGTTGATSVVLKINKSSC